MIRESRVILRRSTDKRTNSKKPEATKTQRDEILELKQRSGTKKEHGVVKKNIFSPQYEQQAFDYIKQLKEVEFLSYSEISHKLFKEGYTGPKGGILSQPVISRFMIERGYRAYSAHDSGAAESQKVITMENLKSASPLERQIMSILQSVDFSPDKKIKLIKTLVEDES